MNKDKYIKITKNVIMFFMYFLWQIVPILFLEVMGLDSSKFNLFQKNLYLILSNLSYLIIVVLVYYKELKLDKDLSVDWRRDQKINHQGGQ